MNIAIQPGAIQRRRGNYEVTLSPIAFRPSRRHPWRSYGAGNPRYRYDVQAHIYEVQAIHGAGEVLLTRQDRFIGRVYETHCARCGSYLVLYFVTDWNPSPADAVCGSCMESRADHLPQDATLYMTHEYQKSLRAPEPVKREWL